MKRLRLFFVVVLLLSLGALQVDAQASAPAQAPAPKTTTQPHNGASQASQPAGGSGTSSSSAAPAKAPNPNRKFLMWKVTSPTSTMYLVGSIHLANESMYPLPAQVEAAFNSSKVLVVEADVRHVDQAKAQQFLQQYGMYPQGDSLSKHLTPEIETDLHQFCAKYEFPCENFEPLKPWAVTLMVGVLPFKKSGANAQQGIDMHFLNEASDKRVDELEGADYQLKLLSGGTEKEQQASLAEALKRTDRSKELETAYETGDVENFVKKMQESAEGTQKEYYKRFIDDRNARMADLLDQYLNGKDTAFVVVGAAHVVGDKGLAKLLADKKYNVERITYAW
jgi:uncharacterized protein YbaP (TraB family)